MFTHSDQEQPMRKPLVIALAAASVAAGTALATPASAACSVGCSATNLATFTLTGSGIFAIAQVPASALGVVAQTASGVTVSGDLGLTTVTDGLGSGGWTVNASSSAFTGALTGTTPIPASAASLTSDLSATPASNASKTTGGTATVTGYTISDLSNASKLADATNVSGVLSVITKYTPHITIAVPATAVPDTYTGTVTQTLS
jgi:hypothetical protein